jgi:hypothetical protein
MIENFESNPIHYWIETLLDKLELVATINCFTQFIRSTPNLSHEYLHDMIELYIGKVLQYQELKTFTIRIS